MSPTRPGINSPEKEAYFSEELRAFRKAIHLPLILVGGIRSFEVAERLVDDGLADYIAMSRPFIREPDLIKRWRPGDRRRAECKSDNLCFKPAFAGQGIYCLTAGKRGKVRLVVIDGGLIMVHLTKNGGRFQALWLFPRV